jgi:NADH:ubiquinone oxidoreductase subunit 5 (subunit L)/multisubunit Na+/H+ antiporter MnhA subunit
MLSATGTQDLNKMGGLMKYMPATAVTALVASFSISGVPLFNGFASKWSIYVATIQGASTAKYLAVCGLIAIVTSALTLASFIKFFGVSFLSRSSALVEERARAQGRLEVNRLMQGPQIFLAVLCVLLGIAPALAWRFVHLALQASGEGFGGALAAAAAVNPGLWTGMQESTGAALFMPLGLALLLALIFLGVRLLSKLGRPSRRVDAPWLCGYAREAECHRYIAHNFYGEIKRYFGWLGGVPHRRLGRSTAAKEH